MSYKALYRKYRSQTFDELVGQQAIIKTLENALKKNKISHAYLFCGPRGTGKTSIARLFAKALNCEKGLGEQCNECDNCKAIMEGSHPDVIEIDAASNSGVEEARSLIEKVRYSPIKGRYKVYIIDEVHMMTNSAFNALLKTLEEPPAYVVFILCTTEPYKLLPTIISRCQKYEFKKISDEDLTTLIKRVLVSEGVKADKEAIELLVELANGGARDALSLLDQIIAYAVDEIKVSDIEQVFGLTSSTEKVTLLKYISQGDTLNVLNKYQGFLSRNVDVMRLTDELLLTLKDCLIYRETRNDNLIITNLGVAKELSTIFSSTLLNQMIQLLIDCQKDFKVSSNANFTFEIYLLKLLELAKGGPIPSLLNEPVKPQVTPKKTTLEAKPVVEVKEDVFKPEPVVKQETPVIKPQKPVEKPVLVEKKPVKPTQNVKMLNHTGLATFIDNANLINILAIAKKDNRNAISENWYKLENYVDDPEFALASQTLIESSVFVATEEHILLATNYEIGAKIINLKENQKLFKDLVKKITGKDYFIYALNRSRYTDIKKAFLDLKQVGQVPNKDDIHHIEIGEEEIE